MSIEYAILGFLSWQPATGYDLKKMFAASPILYWSGNNNQIYRALVALHKEKRVTKEVEYQEDNPPRKIYTITDTGREALRQWVLTQPDLPQIRHFFLIQLMWADQLTNPELDNLLSQYAEEIRIQLLMLQEQNRRANHVGQQTPRTTYLMGMIQQKWLSFYENELQWIARIRQELPQL